MNFNPRHFLRMSRLARRPPSEQRVKLVLGVILIVLALWGVERLLGTPDWMQIDQTPRPRIAR